MPRRLLQWPPAPPPCRCRGVSTDRQRNRDAHRDRRAGPPDYPKAGAVHRDLAGAALPAGLQELGNGARSVSRRLGAAAPLTQDALLFSGIGQHDVPQTFVDVVSKLRNDASQPAGQSLDGVSLVELGAEDQVAQITRGILGAVAAEKV